MSRSPALATRKIGAGDPVPIPEALVLPVSVGARRILVRTLVVPGELRLLLCRPTRSHLEATIDFLQHTPRTPDQTRAFQPLSVGHYTVDALGSAGPAASPACALVARAVLAPPPVAAGLAAGANAPADDPLILRSPLFWYSGRCTSSPIKEVLMGVAVSRHKT